MRLAWALALRDLRGGLGGLRLLAICLLLGVAAIAGIGSLSSAVGSALAAQGRAILGGDVSITMTQRHATAPEAAAFARLGQVSEGGRLNAMVSRGDGAGAVLAALKAVDDAYPLVGTLRLAPGAISQRTAPGQILLAPELAERLAVRVGQRVRVGETALIVGGIIADEPDKVGEGFSFGPTAILGPARPRRDEADPAGQPLSLALPHRAPARRQRTRHGGAADRHASRCRLDREGQQRCLARHAPRDRADRAVPDARGAERADRRGDRRRQRRRCLSGGEALGNRDAQDAGRGVRSDRANLPDPDRARRRGHDRRRLAGRRAGAGDRRCAGGRCAARAAACGRLSGRAGAGGGIWPARGHRIRAGTAGACARYWRGVAVPRCGGGTDPPAAARYPRRHARAGDRGRHRGRRIARSWLRCGGTRGGRRADRAVRAAGLGRAAGGGTHPPARAGRCCASRSRTSTRPPRRPTGWWWRWGSA